MATRKAKGLARDEAHVERQTERYLELRRQAFRATVDTLVEMGDIVIDMERRMAGEFGAWLARVGTSRSSAYNYASLARLAREAPQIIQRWKELGPSKLYAVARLPPAARSKVLRRGQEEKLARTTDEQFTALVAPFVVRRRKVTPGQRAHGLRMRLRSWVGRVRAARIEGIDDAGQRDLLRADIDALVEALEALRRRV